MKDQKVGLLESRLGKQMAGLVERRGGIPFHAPTLAEVPDVEPDRIAALVRELKEHPARLMIFQTGVGTKALFATTDALGATADLMALLEKATVAVRGPKPTGALRARKVRIDLETGDPFTTTELLKAVTGVELKGQRVVVQRYGVTNTDLEEALKARGAQVIEIPVYRWSLPEDTQPMVDLIDALERDGLDAVAVTNAAQVHNLFQLAQRLGRADALREGLNRTLVASVGPVASGALRSFGVKVGLEASPPKLGPLLAALEQALG